MARIGLVVPVYKNFEGFAALMKSVDHVVLPIIIPNWEKNMGVSVGWNIGIKKAIEEDCAYALVCNDDIELGPKTIHKLIDGILDGYDLVTPVNTKNQAAADLPEYQENPDFACFMIRPAQFVEKFGNFDIQFSPAYFEDNDMAYRIKLAGGKAVCRTDAGMLHHGSVTQNWGGGQVVTGSMFERNQGYYVSKWGGLPCAETYTQPFNGVEQ